MQQYHCKEKTTKEVLYLYYYRSTNIWKAWFMKNHKKCVKRHNCSEALDATLLTGSAFNTYSTALAHGYLPLTFYNVSFDLCRGKIQGPVLPNQLMWLFPQPIQMGFTNLSVNNISSTFYKFL